MEDNEDPNIFIVTAEQFDQMQMGESALLSSACVLDSSQFVTTENGAQVFTLEDGSIITILPDSHSSNMSVTMDGNDVMSAVGEADVGKLRADDSTSGVISTAEMTSQFTPTTVDEVVESIRKRDDRREEARTVMRSVIGANRPTNTARGEVRLADQNEVCDVCGRDHNTANCPELAEPLVQTASKARLTLPNHLELSRQSDGEWRVVTKQPILAKSRYGPVEARRSTREIVAKDVFALEILGKSGQPVISLDTSSENECNWLCLVRTASSEEEQNCIAYQINTDVYYSTSRELSAGEELRVWYAPHYAVKLNKPSQPNADIQDMRRVRARYASVNDYRNHLYDNASGGNERCSRCGLTCSSLSVHICAALVAGVCKQCCKPCASLSDHVCSTQNDYTCKLCHTAFDTGGRLMKHLKWHKHVDDEVMKVNSRCARCGESFESETSLVQHLKHCEPDWDPNQPEQGQATSLFLKKRPLSSTCQTLELEAPKRPRGRPRKTAAIAAPAPAPTSRADDSAERAHGTRGVRVDVQKLMADESDEDVAADGVVAPQKRRRGRPRKNASVTQTKRKPGRPPKQEATREVHLEIVTEDSVLHKVVMQLETLEGGDKHKEEDEDDDEEKLESDQEEDGEVPTDFDLDSFEMLSEDKYRCLICKSEFEDEDTVKTHIERHRNAMFCSGCKCFFTDDDKFAEHECSVELQGSAEHDLRCSQCDKPFDSLPLFRQHMISHKKNFHCIKCSGTFKREETLKLHVCVDADEPGSECDICGDSFRSEALLKRHLTRHSGEFSCTNCKQTFSRKPHLLEHLQSCDPEQLVEGEYASWPCLQCKRVFRSEIKLLNHAALHDGWFKCSLCCSQFSTQANLDAHKCGEVNAVCDGLIEEEDDDALKPFICGECGKRFKQQVHLDLHTNRHAQKYACSLCRKAFRRHVELLAHSVKCEAQHKIQQDGYIVCDLCPAQFTDAKVFQKHHLIHQAPYSCCKCSKPYKYIAALQSHEEHCTGESGHVTDNVHCKICQKKFTCEQNLAKHMVFHTNPRYQCAYCKKRFYRKDYYNHHVCRRPDGTVVKMSTLRGQAESRHECAQCAKTFVCAGNLNKHMLLHGEKRLSCDLCGKRFHHAAALRVHRRWVHSRTLEAQCGQCGKMLKSQFTLEAHIKLFHNETNTKSWSCPFCHKQFRQRGNMTKHMLKHSDERTYKCPLCPRSFKYPEQMSKHRVEHEQGRRYVCGECDKTFVKEYEVKKHITAYHSGQMFACQFCKTGFRHPHTLKRHIKRRHPERISVLEQDNYIETMRIGTQPGQDEFQLKKMVTPNLVPSMEQQVSLPSTIDQYQQQSGDFNEALIMDQSAGEEEVNASDTIISGPAAELLQNLAGGHLQIALEGGTITVSSLADLAEFADQGSVHLIHQDPGTNELVIVALDDRNPSAPTDGTGAGNDESVQYKIPAVGADE